jgi:hypothetical protein
MSCPATGIRDFPIQNNVTVTETLNQSIFEEASIEVQWAKRGTVPSFKYQGYFTEGIYGSDGQSTSLRFRGINYTLQFAKLVKAQHTGFLSPELKPLAIGEIIMGFVSPTALTEKYVIFSIPILNKTHSSISAYLESIRQDKLPGRPIGLDELLPFSKDYTSYTTCLQQVTSGNTTAVQANVLVFRKGLLYPKGFLDEVVKKINIPGPNGRVVNSIIPPDLGSLPEGLMVKTNTTAFSISTEDQYRSYLRSSALLESDKRIPGGRRVDSTDAYKCVPLNPDKMVKDKRLVIDTDKGVPLSQVLDEKKEDSGEAQITPGMVERMIAVILGTVAGIFILAVVAYLFSRVTSQNADIAFPWILDKTQHLLPIVFVSLIVGVIGFLIGFFTSTR